MLKKIVAATAFAASLTVGVPTSASANEHFCMP